MDWQQLAGDLVGSIGPLPAIAIIGLAWEVVRRGKRIDQLTDATLDREREASAQSALILDFMRRLETMMMRGGS